MEFMSLGRKASAAEAKAEMEHQAVLKKAEIEQIMRGCMGQVNQKNKEHKQQMQHLMEQNMQLIEEVRQLKEEKQDRVKRHAPLRAPPSPTGA